MDRVRKMIRYGCVDRLGLSGSGITVAVLDSGVMMHPDFADRMILFRDFTKRGKIGAYDDCGHGTHINGILAGDGRISNGQFQGIAPGCQLINAKILNHKGEGDSEGMLRALEWLLEIRKEYRIRILNLSIAVYQMQDLHMLRALEDMLERLSDEGILVVTAAGNHGPGLGTISELAAGAKVLTVGCHDFGYRDAHGRTCELHSGRGIPGGEICKPDLVAPGTDIAACGFQMRRNGRAEWGYVRKTGTSMSVPIISGAAALLLEKYPQMGVYMAKRKIQKSTTDLHEERFKQGYGMLNLEKMFFPV